MSLELQLLRAPLATHACMQIQQRQGLASQLHAQTVIGASVPQMCGGVLMN